MSAGTTVRVGFHRSLAAIKVYPRFPIPGHSTAYVMMGTDGANSDIDVTFYADPVDVAAMFRRLADEIDEAVTTQAVSS